MIASELVAVPAVAVTRNEPDAAGLVTAIARIGYSIEEALADLVDNSIDAEASGVLIRFIRDDSAIRRMVTADDGHGMTEPALQRAMKFGARMDHQPSDLGRYGMGLKSASFSQCRSVTVLSKAGGDVTGRRWTLESISRGWLCEELDAGHAAAQFRGRWGDLDFARGGTLVIWDGLDRFHQDRGGIDPTLDHLMRRIPNHLGLVFHRFIGCHRLQVRMEVQTVGSTLPPLGIDIRALDPFGYPVSGDATYPRTFAFNVAGLRPLRLTAHIWPPKSKAEGYRLGGGRVAQRQGFYFYRNDRLIQAGGWNGWRDNDLEPHASLARAVIDLPSAADSVFSLNVQKSAVDVPPGFAKALEAAEAVGGASLSNYIPDAEKVYRAAQPDEPADARLVPGQGFPKRLQREVMGPGPEDERFREIDFIWATLEADEFFRVDRATRTVRLNSTLRRAALYGARGSATDAPMVKALLFYLLRDEMDMKHVQATRAQHLRELSRLLSLAARFQV